MKHFVCILLLGVFATSGLYAKDRLEDKDESSVEKSSSYNPLTGTKTDTTIRKQKRKIQVGGETAEAEDTTKIQKKTSADGKKSSVKKENTYTEERL